MPNVLGRQVKTLNLGYNLFSTSGIVAAKNISDALKPVVIGIK